MNWMDQHIDFHILGYREKYESREVSEGSIPDLQKEALDRIRRQVDEVRCLACRRIGTSRLQPGIYENRRTVTHINGSRKGEIEVYKSYYVHLRCNADHEGTGWTHDNSDPRITCLVLERHGANGMSRACREDHVAFRERKHTKDN